MGISTDEAGDALAALIQGGYGVAPRNPTNGMLIAYMEALTPPANHESVVTAIGKARVRWQAMLAQGTEMAMSRKRLAASADTHPKGGDVKQAPAPLSGAVGAAETPKGQHHGQ
jgi:hypothetical protein